MDKKTQYKFLVAFGAAIIAGVIFIGFRYLFKGPPMIKVAVLLAIMLVIYLIFDFLKKNYKKFNNDGY